jgi:hypothetical protein
VNRNACLILSLLPRSSTRGMMGDWASEEEIAETVLEVSLRGTEDGELIDGSSTRAAAGKTAGPPERSSR